jgi:hypothetical protein
MYSLRVGGILQDSILYYNVPNNGLDLKNKNKNSLMQ